MTYKILQLSIITIAVIVVGGIGIYAAYQPIIADAQTETDTTNPVATITSNRSSPMGGNFLDLTIDWSEPVNGFSKSDIKTQFIKTSGFFSTDSQTWTVTLWITYLNDGTHTVTIPANSVHDAAGNGNEEASFTFSTDHNPPAIHIDHYEHTQGTVGFIVSFSEPVTGFTQDDFIISPSYGSIQGLYSIILWQEYHNPQGYGVFVKNIGDSSDTIWRASVTIKENAFYDKAGTGNDPHYYECLSIHDSEPWAVGCSWQY